MKPSIKLIVIFSLVKFSLTAQDLHFSSLHSMSQQIVPEMAGLNNDLEATVFYRKQWKSLGSKYGAIGASVASTLQPKYLNNRSHISGGINLYKEQMNLNSSLTSAKLTVVKHLALNRTSKMSVGINTGIQNLTFDPTQGAWGSQHNGIYYDETSESGETFAKASVTRLDVGSGILYSHKGIKDRFHRFQLGFSAQHLNRPIISFNNNSSGYLPIKYVGFGTFNQKVGKKGSILQTSALYQHQGTFNSLVIGSFLKIKLNDKTKTTSSFARIEEVFVGFGGYMRAKDAFVASVMFQKTSWIASLSYDFTTSGLKSYNYSKGAIELQLQFLIPNFQPMNHN